MQLLLILGISLSAIFLLPTQPLPAKTLSVPQPSTAPLELSLLEPSASPEDGGTVPYKISCDNTVITSYTICQEHLTIPSLWWANEQFGSGRLDTNWLAYPGDVTTPGRVDLVVNRQDWSLLDYLERYEFVNQFGAVARDFGYNLRVFTYQKELLATYTCNFSTTPSVCDVQLKATGKARIRAVRSTEGLP